jgi:hypothetical protein
MNNKILNLIDQLAKQASYISVLAEEVGFLCGLCSFQDQLISEFILQSSEGDMHSKILLPNPSGGSEDMGMTNNTFLNPSRLP